MQIKTRFAPSPTGFLHIGGLRTALFAYLFAKKNNGKFLLRIEDTDRERFVEGGVENILNSLEWAGLKPDEGVVLKNEKVDQVGRAGPYVQSERLDIYKEHVQKLIDDGHAYHCFCKKERLDELREDQQKNKKPTIYDGYCRDLPADVVKSKLEEEDSPHVVRMRVPRDGITKFNDLIRGEVEFKNNLIDDQVLQKSDGFPTYHLANVVDDHLMEITHVIRGEEWLSSTPKHILLYEMFGWDVPEFVHISLLVNEKKQKLSKRHGDVSVHDFIEKGYLPEAMNNFTALLGWNPGDDRELFSLEDLKKEFGFDKATKSAAVFNLEKLNWFNKHYIAEMNPEELAKVAEPFFQNAGLEVSEKIVQLEQGRANTLQELAEETAFIFADELEYEPKLLVWKKSTTEDAKEKLSLLHETLNQVGEWSRIESEVMDWIKDSDFGNGDVLWPMRVALSGKKNSPGPFEIASVLGKEKTLTRIQKAINLL